MKIEHLQSLINEILPTTLEYVGLEDNILNQGDSNCWIIRDFKLSPNPIINFGLKFSLNVDVMDLNVNKFEALQKAFDEALMNKIRTSELVKHETLVLSNKIKELQDEIDKLNRQVTELIPYKHYVDVQKEINVKEK
jgi:hypothetical protein